MVDHGRVLKSDKVTSNGMVVKEKFVEWYNFEHKHSGLDYLSPYEVHEGISKEILDDRNVLLESNRIMNPTRHGGKKKMYKIPEIVELKHRVTLKAVS